MEQNQNGLSVNRLHYDIHTLGYVMSDLRQYIDNELKDISENTADDISKLPLYKLDQSEIRIQIYESVKESLEDFIDMYEATIDEILDDMAEQEELANRDSDYCAMADYHCDDCYISECSSSACER